MLLLVDASLKVSFQLPQSFLAFADSWFELYLLEQTLLVRIDQTAHTPFGFPDGLPQLLRSTPVLNWLLSQPPLVFLLNSLRIGQERAYILPDSLLQRVAANRLV